MRRLNYCGVDIEIAKSGDVYFQDGGLIERGWDGLREDYVIYIPQETQKHPIPIRASKLIKMAYKKKS